MVRPSIERAVFEDDWLQIFHIISKPKTKVFCVMSKSSKCELGKILWMPSWRRYVFSPTIDFETVFSDRCLFSLSEFVLRQNVEHKYGKSEV
jgi:hypothetical protein